MSTTNVFAGSVRATFPTTASAVASGSQLTAAQLVGGINVDGTAGGNVQLPTAASLGAYFFARGGIEIGDSFDFTNITNNGAAASTITTAAGMTIVGSAATAATVGTAARFVVRCSAVPTDAAGTGATFSVYRAS